MSGFGPYRIVRELGRGGMGRVYEVAHPEMPGRRLALKLAPVANERTAARFAREVELLGRIRHPGVVAVHASGVAPEGPWMVMDLIEGRNLADALREQGALAPGRAGEVAVALGEAVAALHAAGLLHRDLKPDNVMLRGDGTPVLVDFGLAWAEDVDRLTRTGAVIGTPTYLAPELLGAGPARPDARVDVWGLGTILFALLSGEAPFAESRSFPDTVRRILEDEPRWPPGVPAPLLAVLRRALAKRPGDRQPDAGAFTDELRRALRGEAPPGAQARAPRGLALLACAATLLALGALAARGLRSTPPEATPAVASTLAPTPTAAPPSPTAASPPRWQRLEHPGQPERAAGAFARDGSGRFLTWAAPDLSPGRSELVEWRLGPEGASPTGRRWELAQEVGQLAFAGGRALLVVARTVFALDLDAPGTQPRALLPPQEERVTALAVQADGRRFALGVGGVTAPPRVLAFALEGEAARLELGHELPGARVVSGLLVEPEGVVASAFGSISVNGLVQLPAGGGAVSRVPTTTAPTLVARDPLGALWLGTDSMFLHRCDLVTGLVEQQLEGVAAQSHFEAPGGSMTRAPSHNGAPMALLFVGQPRPMAYSLSNDTLDGVETPAAPEAGRARELRGWEEADGEWRNVAGVAGFPAPLRSLDLSPDGRWLLLGHGSALELLARDALPPVDPGARRLPAWEQLVAGLRR